MTESMGEAKASTDLSSLLGSLISNPEALSKIGEIISNATSTQEGDNPPHSIKIESNLEDSSSQIEETSTINKGVSPTFQNSNSNDILLKLPKILSKLSSEKGENSIATKQQIALLLAIRPYLSEHRKELIDTFIKMNRLGAIFKNLT
jgi:hypothetical protein